MWRSVDEQDIILLSKLGLLVLHAPLLFLSRDTFGRLRLHGTTGLSESTDTSIRVCDVFLVLDVQLYVQGELVGGLDIIKEMKHEGALAPQLGVTPKVRVHTHAKPKAGARFKLVFCPD